MVRTENDLRTVLRALEPAVPDQDAVLRGVRRRVTRRRLVQAGSTVSGVAAVVTAIALVTGVGSGPQGPVGIPSPAPTQRAQTAAFIIGHAASAEKAAAQMIQVTRNGAGVTYLSVATQQTLFISSLRVHGRPLMASSESIKGTTYTATLIDYKDRAYNIAKASTRDGGPWGAKGIVVGSWLPGVTASDPAAAYTLALRKGIIKVIGYRGLDGRKTILIRINGARDKSASGTYGKKPAVRARSCKPLPKGGFEVWLDASTYLERQEAMVQPKYSSHEGCLKFTGWSVATTRVQWLRPTRHNLARLNLTPPAGFAQVSGHQMDVLLRPYS